MFLWFLRDVVLEFSLDIRCDHFKCTQRRSRRQLCVGCWVTWPTQDSSASSLQGCPKIGVLSSRSVVFVSAALARVTRSIFERLDTCRTVSCWSRIGTGPIRSQLATDPQSEVNFFLESGGPNFRSKMQGAIVSIFWTWNSPHKTPNGIERLGDRRQCFQSRRPHCTSACKSCFVRTSECNPVPSNKNTLFSQFLRGNGFQSNPKALNNAEGSLQNLRWNSKHKDTSSNLPVSNFLYELLVLAENNSLVSEFVFVSVLMTVTRFFLSDKWISPHLNQSLLLLYRRSTSPSCASICRSIANSPADILVHQSLMLWARFLCRPHFLTFVVGTDTETRRSHRACPVPVFIFYLISAHSLCLRDMMCQVHLTFRELFKIECVEQWKFN